MPTHYARAPGRVNIIGEHIDYCGYSVLPAAIEQDFVMALLVDDSEEIHLANIDEALFPAKTITTNPY
jgi:N-acetylgalactosamine kinase